MDFGSEVEMKKLSLGWILTVIFAAGTAQAQFDGPEAKEKGFENLQNSGKLVSMVLEPAGDQLKIFLTGRKAAAIKMDEATVEVSYFLGGKKTSMIVQRQTDSKSKRPYYLIENIDSSLKDLRIDVKAGEHKESFHVPDLN